MGHVLETAGRTAVCCGTSRLIIASCEGLVWVVGVFDGGAWGLAIYYLALVVHDMVSGLSGGGQCRLMFHVLPIVGHLIPSGCSKWRQLVLPILVWPFSRMI